MSNEAAQILDQPVETPDTQGASAPKDGAEIAKDGSAPPEKVSSCSNDENNDLDRKWLR